MPGLYYRGQCFPDLAQASTAYAVDFLPASIQYTVNCAGHNTVGSVVLQQPDTAQINYTFTRIVGTCTPPTGFTATVKFAECPDPMDPDLLTLLKFGPADVAASFTWGFGVVLTLWALAYATRAGITLIRKI